jgi:uncharacterized sulfatase
LLKKAFETYSGLELVNFISKIQNQYYKYFLVAVTIDLVLRLIETIHVFVKFNPKFLLASELFGYMRDVFTIGIMLLLFYPLYNPLHRRWPFRAKILCWFFIGIFVLLHITISEYFFYQLRPLDIFVFKHRPEEMAFSINTAGFNVFFIPFLKYIFVTLTYLIFVFFAERKLPEISWKKQIIYSYLTISAFFLPLYFFAKLPVSSNLSINKSTFIYVSILKDWYHRMMGPDMNMMSNQYQEEFNNHKYINPEYPFLHQFESNNTLSQFLNPISETPNLVIFIVEGLSDEFLHPIKGVEFMPFLDSLSKQSLYWDRFFTNGERSFAATPCLIGSLPFGKIGFALLNQYPYHFSLVNVFKENNMFTSFYYGQGAWFHGKEPFYKFNNIDQIIDKNNFSDHLEKVFIGEENHFWGYNDFDLYKQYFITTESQKNENRLDIFFTGTSHAPFHLKYPDLYHHKLDEEIKRISATEDKEYFENYRTNYTSLYNVDDAFRYFFEEYSKRADFKNTIFLITGDHPMSEIQTENSLKKYHVPLIIYTPSLKHPVAFHGISSHLDVYETLLSYYKEEHHFKTPIISTALGSGLSFSTAYENKNIVPIMNDNRQVNDFLFDGNFISDDNTLYKVNDNLEITEYYDITKWHKIYKKLQSFRAASLNASVYKKLMPEYYYFYFFNYSILLQNERNEKFLLGPNDMNLIQDLKTHSSQIYIDVEFKRWEHLDFTPQCIVGLYSYKHKLIQEFTFELKSQQEECQFHIPVTIPDPDNPYCFIKAVLRDKEGHSYLISDLKVKAYEKK